jgi:hypothetical protein
LANGIKYKKTFPIPNVCEYILASGRKGKYAASKQLKIKVPKGGRPFEVDPHKPAEWIHRFEQATTAEAYELLDEFQKVKGRLADIMITVQAGASQCGELMLTERPWRDVQIVKDTIKFLQELVKQGEVSLVINRSNFELGSDLIKLSGDLKVDLKASEVSQ